MARDTWKCPKMVSRKTPGICVDFPGDFWQICLEWPEMIENVPKWPNYSQLHLILPIIFDNSWLLTITPNYSRRTPDYSQLLQIALIIPDYLQLQPGLDIVKYLI